MNNIRNFCIIAHIDHGKSTLADRFLELTNTIPKKKMKEQYLDRLDLERERGITIKMAPVCMELNLNNINYKLNLIDTPGHVDFSYEVSRSLKAVEGAILLVDATQGVQAQTISTLKMAKEEKLVIIPVINKIDAPNAQIKKTKNQIQKILNIPKEEIFQISAKTGEGVQDLLHKIIEKIPSPNHQPKKYLSALIFDSFFNPYKGIIAYVRIFSGKVKSKDKIILYQTDEMAEVIEVGHFAPEFRKSENLIDGEIGYVAIKIKNINNLKIGDTVTLSPIEKNFSPIFGFKKPKSMVFASFFPLQGEDIKKLQESLQKFALSDSSLDFESISSNNFGSGFRCSFLGLLHLEIVKERLKREFGQDLIISSPTVSYNVKTINNETKIIQKAEDLPEKSQIISIFEPWVEVQIISPSQYLSQIINLINQKRGYIIKTENFDDFSNSDTALGDKSKEFNQAKSNNQFSLPPSQESSVTLEIIAHIPLSSIITDFFDKLKNISSGFASMNYEFLDYRLADLVKLEFLINHEIINGFSKIVPRIEAQNIAQNSLLKLKKHIPKQMFQIALQAQIDGKIIARENISAYKKDVIAKLYGGDVTRKNKLLKKQAKGKKKMKEIGQVQIPSDVYIKMLKM